MKKNYFVSAGFTLVELMVTLALVAILMAVVVPSMTTFQRNAQLTTFSNTLLSAVNAARGEAMKRGQSAMVVPTDGSSWSSGWVVFVDQDRSRTYTEASDFTVLKREAPPSYLVITVTGTAAASPPYIMFDASGYAKTKAGGFPGNQSFSVKRNDATGADEFAQTRRIKIASTGRVRVCTPKSGSDAQCNASSGL